MTGKEFYHFISSPEGQQRYFIDMDNVVLEVTEAEARMYKAERNHRYYIQSQEEGWSTQSIYDIKGDSGGCGEDVIADDSQDVEAEAIQRIEQELLRKALAHLDAGSLLLLQALYLSDTPKTERELAKERGVSQAAINKQKKKILDTLKSLVIRFQKSQQ